MGAMTVPDVWSGQDRMLTVKDMENMPDDEFRYELDDGILIVSPAPSTLHQLTVTHLAVILSAACPAEFAVLAGVGVNISKFQHRVPDVAVVRVGSLESFFQEIPPELMVEVFNRTVKGLRAKTEVWAHSCWGNPSQQRMFAKVQSYKPSLETYNKVDADVITFESSSSGGMDLEAIGKTIVGKKIAIGVIDHHTLQVESPDEVAAQIREALKYIPPERLVISSDCGMGREGMSRRHAFYKMVSLVLGTNMVRQELGFPEAQCLAADERFSLVVPAK